MDGQLDRDLRMPGLPRAGSGVEMIQVAAVAVAWVECLDRRSRETP